MDKNIAALMRSDTKTIHVRFFRSGSNIEKDTYLPGLGLGNTDNETLSPKTYIYITNEDIQVGDYVVVLVNGIPTVVVVVEIDKGLDIQPNENITYKWVFARIDPTNYINNKEKNREIETLISNAYKKSLHT